MATKQTKSSSTEDKEPSFEKALTRLESIVESMEGGSLSLEDMMKHFEEGSKLAKLCSAKLNEVEKKIEQLVKKDGQLTTQAFEMEKDD